MDILSATDLLPKSEAAIERAGFLADLLKADLAIVHAVAPAAPDGSTLEERVRSARSRLAARTRAPHWRWKSTPEIAVQFDRPARAVLEQAQRGNARLVVLGPHRSSTFPDAVNGTITERVLGAASFPVLIARQDVQGPYRHVLVALDGSPDAGVVICAVESLHLTQERRVTVVHAHEAAHAGMMNIVGGEVDASATYKAGSRSQAIAGIRDLLRTHSSDAGRYEITIVERRPATAILGAVERLQPDLVVLGTRAHGRFRRALLGSVASDVARAAQCDVLLVPDRAADVRGRLDHQTPAARARHTSA